MTKLKASDRAPALPALPCACSNLRRAARTVTQLYSQELRKAGLEPTHSHFGQSLLPLANRPPSVLKAMAVTRSR